MNREMFAGKSWLHFGGRWMVGILLGLLSAAVGSQAGEVVPVQPGAAGGSHKVISAAEYPTIQAAIDANPGRMIYVPSGDYLLSNTLFIKTDYTSLEGPGRLIQTEPSTSIIRVDGAAFVRVAGLTLTRSPEHLETTQEGITVRNCRYAELDGLRIIDNRGPAGSIRVMDSSESTVRNCLIYNYMIITIEDRTGSSLYGFGFNAIDGTGMNIVGCPGILIANNRVIEENLFATPEVREKYDLGHIIKRNPQRGTAMSEEQWKQEYVQSNWHQGSGILVDSSSGQLIGNQIRNAAQGLDIHADNITIANNVIENSHMGMKAMHGARNVLISGNQFLKCSLWGIALSSGTSSHQAQAATSTTQAQEANLDGGSMIVNNIIADFGHGRAAWNWKNHDNRCAILLGWDPKVPLKDVLIQGNTVFDPGRDGMLVDGKPQVVPPGYRYAVMINGDKPQGLHFANNQFHPGTDGISNVELPQ